MQPCRDKFNTYQQTGGQEDGDCRAGPASPNCCTALPQNVDTYCCLGPAHSWTAQLTLQHGGCLVCAPQVFSSGARLCSSNHLFFWIERVANVQLRASCPGHSTYKQARSKTLSFCKVQENERGTRQLCSWELVYTCRPRLGVFVADLCSTTETIAAELVVVATQWPH